MKTTLILSTALLLSACSTIEVTEKTLFHPDSRPHEAASALTGYSMESVTFKHQDGNVSGGLWLKKPGNHATVLYFGGNGFHLDQHGKSVLLALGKVGVDVLVFDHRGSGRSEGKPTVAALRQDALELFDHARSLVANKLVVYGHSLGSFRAASVAGDRKPDGVVLEGTTNNTVDWSQAMLPWYVKPFVQVKLDAALSAVDNLPALQRYQGPLLILAGKLDTQTPPQLAEQLFKQAASQEKQWVLMSDRGHNNLMDSPAFKPALENLLNKL